MRAAALVPVHAAHLGGELEELEHGHVAVDRRVLGQVADALAHLERIVEHVVSGDHRPARRRRQEAGEDLHRGRLAGAVRAQEAEHLAAPHVERNLVDGSGMSVVFGEAFDLNHQVRHGGALSVGRRAGELQVRVELFPCACELFPCDWGYLRRSLPPCQARAPRRAGRGTGFVSAVAVGAARAARRAAAVGVRRPSRS